MAMHESGPPRDVPDPTEGTKAANLPGGASLGREVPPSGIAGKGPGKFGSAHPPADKLSVTPASTHGDVPQQQDKPSQGENRDTSPGREPTERPDIMTQRLRLAEIQDRHDQTLRERGIFEKGVVSLQDPEVSRGETIDPDRTKRVVVNRGFINVGEEQPRTEVINLVFPRFLDPDNPVDTRLNYVYVPVAEKLGDQILPRGEFTSEDALVVDRMVEELGLERQVGSLPDLDPSYKDISDLSTGLARFKEE